MKLFFFATVVAVFCVQALHGSPVANYQTTTTSNINDLPPELRELLANGKSGEFSYSYSSGGNAIEGSSSGQTSGNQFTSGGPSGYSFQHFSNSGGSSNGQTSGGGQANGGGSYGGQANGGGSHGGQANGGSYGGQFNGGASGGQYNFGGPLTTVNGGTTESTTITNGGTSGSTTITTGATTITNGGTGTTGTTGTVFGETITNGGTITVTDGTITNGGSYTLTGVPLTTVNGGTTESTTITNGGTSGSTTITTGSTTITNGGTGTTGTTGTVFGETITNGGSYTVTDGTITTGGTITTDGTITIGGSTTTDGTTATTITEGDSTIIETSAPCGCGSQGGHGHYDFNIDEFDISSINIDEFDSQSAIIQAKYAKECDERVKKLNNDNDNLTRQLRNGNAALALLSEEKSWVLTELEKCRDEFNCQSEDFKTLSIDIKIWMKKYQIVYSEVTQLRTDIISKKNEILSWKTKAENLYIELNNAIQINIKNVNIISEYKTTITNLQQTVNEINIKINNCGSESGEWRRKYENELTVSASLSITIKNYEIKIAELKSTNEKLTNDLSCCQGKNHQYDIDIDGYKDTISDMTKQNSQTTTDLNNCQVSLNQLTVDWNVDELDDLAKQAMLEKTTLELGECNIRVNKLELDWQTEKTRANGLGDEIVVIRGECQEKYSQYDLQITQLNLSYQGQLDQCQGDLSIERTTVNNIKIEITNINNELTIVKNNWNTAVQISSEWESKSQQCANTVINLNQTIQVLRNTIDETNEQLGTCVENGNNLQGELTASQASSDECEQNLADAEKEVLDRDATIEGLLSDITNLNDDNATCNGDLGNLRCSINKFLPVIEAAENDAKKMLLDITGILDQNKINLYNFVGGQDLKCPTCGDVDGPCIQA